MHFFHQNKKSLIASFRKAIRAEKHFITLLSVGILAGVCIWGLASRSAFAQVIPGTTSVLGSEKQISASAILLDSKGSPVPNGEYDVRFGIYRVDRTTSDPYPSDTDAALRVWEETQRVTVKNGIMNAYLGVTTPFPGNLTFEGGEYFLGVRVGTDSEMVPRKKFGTFTNAINSQFLRGKTVGTNAGDIATYGTNGKFDIKQLPTGTSGSKLLLANNKDFTGALKDISGLLDDVSNLQGDSHVQNTDTGTDSLTFNIGSNTAIGSNNFDLTVSNATNAPTLRYNGSAGEWQFSDNGTTFTALGAGSGGSVTGSGTNGYVAYWTGSGTLGSEQRLSTSRGGTGIDTSSSTGVPTLSSGTWSVASALGVSQGGTGLTSTPSNGQLLIGNGSGFSLAILSVGNGLSVTNGSGSVSLALDVTTTGTTSTTQSNSGLELVASGLRLLGGCSDGEVLKWDSGSSVWACGTDLGGVTAIINVNEGATAYSGIDTLTFNANDFSISQLGSEAMVTIDYANSGIARLGQDETVTGAWNFSGNTTFGTIVGGVWNGTAIGATYGGTGINTSGSTGVPYITGGTWSVDATALSVVHGGTGATSLNNLITLGTHTTGNYVATITAGNGISGSASSEGATPTISINLLTSADGTGSTSSNSGLEFQGTGSNELSLIQGCADNEVLSWNDSASVWQCASVSGVGGVTGSATSGQVAYWSGTSTIVGENQLAVSRGGTNIGSYAIGDILYASGATTLAKLSDIATGSVLISGGVGVAPSWGKVALGTHTTGNYVANADTSTLTGLTGGSSGSVGASLSLAFDYSTALSGDPALAANNAIFGTNGLIFEGVTANTFETFITLSDPSADRTFTFPDLSGTIATINGGQTFSNAVWNAAAIGATYGGTGINTSGSTGVPYISSGTWSVDATALAVAHGGTGLSTFGGTNTLLYTTSANTLASLATANSSLLVTNGSGVPSLGTDIPTAVTIGGAYVYRVGGTDVALADGGTGASLSDPNADRILFWDDSAGAVTWLAPSSNLSITTTTLDLASSINVNTLQLGANGTDGSFILYSEQGATDYTTTFQPGTQTQDVTYTLPNDDGTSGQVLLTNGSGVLSWSSVSGAGGVSGTGTTGYAAYWDSSSSIAAEQYLSLTRGGTGTTLSDPNADRILFWDDSGGALTWLSTASNLAFSGTTLDLAPDIQLGSNGADGTLTLYSEQGATDYTTKFQPGTQTQGVVYTLPPDDGDASQVLVTDGSGNLTWQSVSGVGALDGAGSAGAVAYWVDSNTLTYETTLALSRGGTGASLSDPNADRILFWDDSAGAVTWLAPSSNLSITTTTLDLASSINVNTLQLGANGTDGSFILYSEQGATDYTTTFQPGTQTQDVTYTLPNDDGSASQVLVTDGSGALSWQSVSGVGGVTGTGTNNYVAYWTGTSTLAAEAQLAASRGGTGLNTSSSTGVPTISSGTWSVASSLGVALGGTGSTTLTANGVLYGNGTSAIQATSAGTDAQLLIANVSGVPTFVTMGGDATINNTGSLTIAANSVALTTDTTGNYVATITNGNGISGSASSEGATPTLSINLLTSADGTGSTSSNSGLEFQGTGSNELSLIQGCADNEVLSWNDGTSVWQCASVSGVGGVTGSATSGQVAYWSGTSTIAGENQLAVSRGGTNIGSYTIGDILYASGATTLSKLADIATGSVLISGGVGVAPSWGKVGLTTHVTGTLPVGNGGTGATSLTDLIALTTNTTGNYVASITNGNGISGGDGGSEGAALTLALGALTGDWNQTGAFDIVLNNASSELKILESSGATFYGIFDVADLSSNDKTYTFPNATGTVALGTGATNAVAYWSGTNTLTSEAQLSNTRGGTGQDSSGWTGVPFVTAGAWNVSSTLALSRGGTGASLSDPNADRILFWDDSAGAVDWLTPASNFSMSGTTIDLASSVQLGTNGTDGIFTLFSEQGATDYTTTFQPGTQTQNVTYTLPNDDGTSGQVLITDGSGVLSWTSAGSGGIGDITAIGDVTSGDAFTSGGTQGTSLYFYDVDGGGQLTLANLSAVRTWTLPNETGTICTTGSVCSGYQAAGSYLTTSTSFAGGDIASGTYNTISLASSITRDTEWDTAAEINAATTDTDFAYAALSNLSSVAINTSLIPGAAGTIDLGSSSLPWRDIYLAGTSGTPGTNNFKITGASTSGLRTITLPDASGTVITTGNLTGITATGTITSGTWNGTAIGAQYGGTGLNTSASTGVPYISSGTWSVDATSLAIAHGGTGATSLNDLITLGTHTTGNYVASATASGGLTMTGTEGGSLGILLQPSTDALSSTTSSGSGMELLSTGLTLLQGCANDQVLSWNETSDVWVCSDKTAGTSDWTALTSPSRTYLTDTSSDLALGGTSSANSRFYFDVTTGNQIIFEGTGADDANETTLVITNPTADNTITLPNASGTVALTTNNLSVFAATTSVQLSSVLSDENTSGGYMTDPMTTIGDIIYGGASGVPTRLAGGTNGQILQSNTGAAPTWSTASYPATTTINQLLYSSAANTVTGLATANSSFLTTNGSGVPSLTALSTDTFTQYALLAGRAAGQTLIGGTVADTALTLQGNSAAAGNTSTVAGITFNVGNSGGTTALTIINSGNVGIGDASPASLFTVGSGDTFQVDSSGNIVKIRNVAYSWPAAQALGSSYVLVNDGSGGLSWSATAAATAHSLLNSSFHSDTTTGTVARGDIITGQGVSPTWTRLALGSAGKILRSDGTDTLWSTSTFADTYAASTLLYANGADTVAGLATANNAILRTNGSGVPSWTAMTTSGQLLIGGASGPALATLTQGTGMTITNGDGTISIANADLGSSQNIFKTIAVSGQNNVVTDTNSDTLTLVAGSNVTITTDDTTDTITIASTSGTTYSAGSGLTLATTTFSLGGTLTADATLAGAHSLILSDAGSDFRIRGGDGSLYGIFDVASLTSSDKTYTFPDLSGTVALTSQLHTQNTDTGTDGTAFTIGDGTTVFTINTSATDDTITIEQGTFDSILSFTQPGAADQTYTFATGGTVCTTGSVCSGYQAAGSYLTTSTSFAGGDIASGTYNTISLASGITRDTEWDTASEINAATTDTDFAYAALSNLASVAINTSLISDTDNTDDLGSAAIAWKDIYSRTLKLDGSTSGTITLDATAVAGTNTITLPASTGTVALTSDLHSAITLSGSYDYITLSGQDIVRGQVDLATDVTGTLPVGNGGTGTTTFTTNGILYGTGASAISVTAAGTNTQILSNASGTPGWIDQSSISAGTLDGIDSLSFLRSDTSDSFTSGTLSFSDGTLLDLSAIAHDDSSPQGLRLPQNTILTAITGGTEGYLAYDSDDNKVKVFDGSSWVDISGAGASTTLQDAYGNDVDGSDVTISLTTADDSLIFTNPSSSGTDSAFLLQLSQANTTAGVVALDIVQSSNGANAVNVTANSIDTETGLALTANGLTSGYGVTVASSSTAFTGSVADFTLSGSNAANTGSVVAINNTGTASANTALYIKHYATGTNNLAFRIDDVSGDTTPFVVDGSGNVGIGTSAPTSLAELYSASAHPILTLTGADNSAYDPQIQFRTDATPTIKFSLGVDAGDSDKFKIYAGTSGIGDTSQFAIDTTGVTTISQLKVGAQSFEDDAGAVTWIDMNVTSASSNGTIESYTAGIDGNSVLTVYGLADGSGGVGSLGVGIGTTTPTARLDVTNAITTGTVVNITDTAASQTTSTLLAVTASGYTTGYTGNVASFTGVSTTGSGNVVKITSANTSSGSALAIQANALTTGTALTIPHTTSVIANGGSLLRLSSSSVDTSTTTGTLLDLSSSGSTAGTIALLTNNTASFTGITQSIVANGISSGTGLAIASSSAAMTGSLESITLSGSNASNTGNLLYLNSSGVNSVAKALNVAVASTGNLSTTGGVNFTFSGAHTGSGFVVSDATATGTAVSITANSISTGTGVSIASTSTAGGASGSSYLLNLSRSGANSNTAHTAYGVYSTVTNTNATSGTNIAGYFSASGATTANYGLIVAAGSVGIGTTTPTTGLELYDSAASDRIFTITSATATNDPLVKFRTGTTPAVQFSLGVDTSDSNTFKIDSNDGLSTSPDFKIDSTGQTTIANVVLGAQSFPEDAGILSWTDMSVTSSSASGTVESYSAQIDSNPILTVYAESDGSGGIQNPRVGIGTTTPAYALDVLASGTGVIARFNSSNTTGCTLATGGTISCSSDSRLKKNIVSTSLGLETLLALRPVEYNWNFQSDSDAKSFGFIAQEVGSLIPELVRTDDSGYLQLNTIGLVPILTKAVQEEDAKVATLGASMNATSFKTIANATTLAGLQTSVDEQLTAISETENGFEVRLANLEEKATDAAALSIKVTDLESAVTLLQSSNQVLLDFYNSLTLGSVIVKDADGNLDLSNGKIRAKELSTGALAIEIVDEEAPTIGSATLFPKAVDKKGAKDADGSDIPDGIDDISGESMSDASVAARDGKSMTVKTKAVSSGSRIFLTPKQATAEPLAVTNIVEGVGFTVEMKNETSEEIPFDWIVVEER